MSGAWGEVAMLHSKVLDSDPRSYDSSLLPNALHIALKGHGRKLTYAHKLFHLLALHPSLEFSLFRSCKSV